MDYDNTTDWVGRGDAAKHNAIGNLRNYRGWTISAFWTGGHPEQSVQWWRAEKDGLIITNRYQDNVLREIDRHEKVRAEHLALLLDIQNDIDYNGNGCLSEGVYARLEKAVKL